MRAAWVVLLSLLGALQFHGCDDETAEDTPGDGVDTESTGASESDGASDSTGASDSPGASESDGASDSAGASASTGAPASTLAPTALPFVRAYDFRPGSGQVRSVDGSGGGFTHKMMRIDLVEPGGRAPRYAYECVDCTFEQVAAITPPDGWEHGPTQVIFPTANTMRKYPSVEGVADTVDFLPEIPGNEFQLIAVIRNMTILNRGRPMMIKTFVQRDTIFRFVVGQRVHELISPDGEKWIMFTHLVDPSDLDLAPFEREDALSYIDFPAGWEYSTRILDNDVVLDTEEGAFVMNIQGIVHPQRGQQSCAWQLVPSPA